MALAQANNSIDDEPLSKKWLENFVGPQKEVARQLLRSLRLISHGDFERGLRDQVEHIVKQVGDENVALVPVTESASNYSGNSAKTTGSSSDRLSHTIENIRRTLGPSVLANPTVTSMKAERIRNIILIDDYVGSGKRVCDHWMEHVGRSEKSWISYGWTKVWLVAYAACETGLRRAMRKVRKLESSQIRTVLPPHKPAQYLSEPMQNLAIEHSHRVNRSGVPLGFGSCGCTYVFEHGCPNNAPAILWGTGKSGAHKAWHPLFPNRGIPSALSHLFGTHNQAGIAEVLWDSGQYRMALSLLDHRAQQDMDRWLIFVALSIASRSRWDDLAIARKLALPEDAMRALRTQAYSLHLIDTQDHRLTPFGIDVLETLRQTAVEKRPKPKAETLSLEDLYYPDTCGGIAKH